MTDHHNPDDYNEDDHQLDDKPNQGISHKKNYDRKGERYF